MAGKKQVKKLLSSSTTNSGAKKDDTHKSASVSSLLSPTTYKSIRQPTRRSQLLSALVRSAPSPPQPSSPTVPSPPTTLAQFQQPSPPQSPSHTNARVEEDNTINDNEIQPKPKRKKRGMTQLKGLGMQDNSNAKIEVVFNEKGQLIGDASKPFASFIGALARNKVPITVDDWKKVSSTQRKDLWTLVLLRYKIDEIHKDYVLQKMAASVRGYRCQVGTAVKEALQLDEAEKAAKLAMLKPGNLTDNQWSEFIKQRTSVKFQARSVLMKQVRKKHTHPHTMSRLGYARLEEKLKQENPGQAVTRAMLWTKGHINKKGNPTNKAVEDSIKKIQQFHESQSKTANQSLTDDALLHVLGADRPGRLTGLGFGVTSSKLKAQSQSSIMVRSLEEKIRALEAKVDVLTESRQNSAGNGVDGQISESDARQSNRNSSVELPASVVGAKCKLLSWYKEGEVVAEGKIFSTNPTDLVHFKPLGLDAWRVFVEFAINAESFLWRSTDELKVVGDAVGSTVAWSKDYISFDLSG